MRWDLLPGLSAFGHARRREAYRRLGRAVRGQEPPDLLDLDEVRERLRLFDQHYVGIEPIPVDRVVGTASRGGEFDRDFLPRDEAVRERWRRVEQAFPAGDFPPIVVYRVGQSYFVVDGHHRVAVARARGVRWIDAEITELTSRISLPPDADVGALILMEQERIFMEETGLDRARPEARIPCSRPHGYLEMLELVRAQAYELSVEKGRLLSPEEAAGGWYDRIYLPTVEAIHREGLPESFPDAPDGDLFLWAHDRRRILFPDRPGVSLEDAIREAGADTRGRRPSPERRIGRRRGGAGR